MRSVNILYQSDNNYASLTGISLVSFFENNKQLKNVNVYILNNDIKDNELEKLKKTCVKYGSTLINIDCKEYHKKLKKMGLKPFRKNFTTYLRIFALKDIKFPGNRVLILDSDTIINSDLSKLLFLKLDGNICAAVCDSVSLFYKRVFGFPIDKEYFNAGVLLVDTAMWKKEKCTEKIKEYVKNVRKDLYLADQDLLNIILRGKIKKIDITYNFNSEIYIYGIKNFLCINELKNNYYTEKEINKAYNNPIINHCLGVITGKPWEEKNFHPIKEKFEYYKSLSCWASAVPKKPKMTSIVKIQKILFTIFPKFIYNKIHIIATRRNISKNVYHLPLVEVYYCIYSKKIDINFEGYQSLQVGSEINKKIDCDNYDNSGENISSKNPYYSELTGLYWMWKNSKADIIGLTHYRRFFYKNVFSNKKNILKKKRILKYLNKYDIIVCKKAKSFNLTVEECYKKNHIINDLKECENIIKRDYKEYMESYKKVMMGKSLYPCNMFISRKSIIDDYCEWLFPILFEVESKISDLDKRDAYNRRTFGFLSERLFTVWLTQNRLKYKIKEVSMFNLEQNILIQRIESIVKGVL